MKTNLLQMLVGVLGGLGVFLYGMRVMSRGLESVGGQRMRIWLQSITNHPLAGVMTGFLVTCVIQSSSATTVMLVSLVHAGFLKLTQAIGVIMGANIGTTVTGWIVALLGFKVKISKFALPAVATGVLFLFIGSGRRLGMWGEILVGFGLLFLGLMFMKDSVTFLRKAPELTSWLQTYSASSGILAMAACVLIGTLVTVMIQSSSATMALTITLAQQGLIDFPTAAALILGENIGTTITANLAAIGTTIAARRAAFAHFIFNGIGVVWALVLFTPLLMLVDAMVPGHALSADVKVRSAVVGSHMAAFHTTFNIINTLIFLPFVLKLAALATKVIPGEDDEDNYTIKYLETSIISTPELALTATRQELQRMAVESSKMFVDTIELLEKGEDKARKLADQIAKSEEFIDLLEREITGYLAKVLQHELTHETSQEISACMHMAHNFEKIGDHCESILRTLRRKYDKKVAFSETAHQELREFSQLVKQALALLEENLTQNDVNIMERATELENQIDKTRGDLRDGHIARIVDGSCDANAGITYIDILTSFEKIGDHVYNIAQYISKQRSS